MVSLYVLSILGLLVAVGIGKLVSNALTDAKPVGPTPQRVPLEARAPASSHRVVSLHGGAPLAAQLREHAALAEELGLRPFLEFGALWCPPSRMFGEVLGDPRMVAALSGVYLIRVELDDFSGDPLARELGVVAVPVFFELDATGRSTGRSVNGGAWGADTVENMSSTMSRFFAA